MGRLFSDTEDHDPNGDWLSGFGYDVLFARNRRKWIVSVKLIPEFSQRNYLLGYSRVLMSKIIWGSIIGSTRIIRGYGLESMMIIPYDLTTSPTAIE